jgi:hypothetical protein
MSVTIKTNHTPRECTTGMYLWGCLKQQLKAQFNYLTEDEFDYAEFFQYRGDWYSVGEFVRVIAAPHEHLYGWDGYISDSYFSGVVMKYCYDGTVIVGRYFS